MRQRKSISIYPVIVGSLLFLGLIVFSPEKNTGFYNSTPYLNLFDDFQKQPSISNAFALKDFSLINLIGKITKVILQIQTRLKN